MALARNEEFNNREVDIATIAKVLAHPARVAQIPLLHRLESLR